ncbi:MAG: hypothetical protein ACRD5B_13620 [Nitrososphaeraceae archaeon]
MVEITQHDRPKQDSISNKKVFYNDEQMRHVIIEFKRPDEDDDDKFFVSEYPDVLNGAFPDENVSEARINEAQHFLKISIVNNKNNVIKVRKIPYNSIIEIEMCTLDRECKHDLGIKNLSESEKNSLK